ncbi:MAG: Peptidyl-prolyl cis-trans isomerase, partial [uncultured Solirubrobacteraceae bacterium]
VDGHHEDLPGRHHHRALRRGRPQDGPELQGPRRQGLLRRPLVPPDHQGLHDPGRRPAGERHGRAGLHVRGRDQPAQDRPRRARDGQRRPEHERLAVLPGHHAGGAVARRQAHRLRPGHGRPGRPGQARGAAHGRPRQAPGRRDDPVPDDLL